MKSSKEVAKIWCRCADDYTLRGRVDPQCPCEIIEEVVDNVREEMGQELLTRIEALRVASTATQADAYNNVSLMVDNLKQPLGAMGLQNPSFKLRRCCDLSNLGYHREGCPGKV